MLVKEAHETQNMKMEFIFLSYVSLYKQQAGRVELYTITRL